MPCMRDSEFESVANAVRDCYGVGARKNQTRVSGNTCNRKQISLRSGTNLMAPRTARARFISDFEDRVCCPLISVQVRLR